MPGPLKARRTQHFPDTRLEHQVDELVCAINAALDALDQMGVDIGQRLADHVTATSGVHGVGDSEVESKAGAQAKADAAQAGAKAYTDTAKAAVQANLDAHASDVTLHITDDYRGAMDASKVHPSATNPFVTEESLNDAMTGAAKPGVQTLADLAAVPPEERADKDTRLVENEGKIYRFDADADHGDVKPLEGQGYWIVVAAATQNHNNLSNLQGGSASERYHLTRAERDSLVGHLSNTSNPHQVTPQQIGAETQAGAQEKADAAEAAAKAHAEQQAAAAEAAAKGYTDAHASRTDNPHRVTAAQVGAYPAGSKVADSERLNGQPASYYTNIPARLGYTPVNKAGDTMTGALKLEGQNVVIKRPSASGGWARGLDQRSGDDSSTREAGIGFLGSGQNPPHTIYLGFGDSPWTGGRGVLITEDGVTFKGNKVWHAGNDGSGSGLDADLLDGQHGSYYASKASVDDVSAAVNSVSSALTTHKSSGDHDGRYYRKTESDSLLATHKSSGDHDGRYYTKSQLNTSGGGGQVHWNNVTSKPSIPSSPVPVTQLKKATGSYILDGSEANMSVAVHRYALASPLAEGGTNPYVSRIGQINREWMFFHLRDRGDTTFTWDYLTASGHPRVWAEVDELGEIVSMWEAEDPADPDFPDEPPIEVSKDDEGNPISGRLVLPLLMPDEWAISTVRDRLLTASRGQWLTRSRFAAQVDPVSIHRAMCDEQLQERGLEIPDDIRAVFTHISDYDRRHWYLQLWLRQASRLLHDHRASTLIPLYREMFRVDRRTGRLVLR